MCLFKWVPELLQRESTDRLANVGIIRPRTHILVHCRPVPCVIHDAPEVIPRPWVLHIVNPLPWWRFKGFLRHAMILTLSLFVPLRNSNRSVTPRPTIIRLRATQSRRSRPCRLPHEVTKGIVNWTIKVKDTYSYPYASIIQK